ncbi:MAG: 30S ribosomal protein S16 [Erysipelotrichaceae bacterium]|jgi:small subunit ribosomal protein S16|nr:30S ribosomal protein S16 [Erysipelotrichaceae bacterium]
MAVKLRLTRTGRHQDPFYRIVAADSRYTRDGRFIEQIGYYDPSKGVKEVVVDEEKALAWLAKGATPSETVRSMLSAKGIMAKHAEAKKVEKSKK